jgi:hypothetical protein
MSEHRCALLRPPSGGAGMVEVDVGDEDVLYRIRREAKIANASNQCGERGAGTGFDERKLLAALDEVGRDDLRLALEAEIDGVEAHGLGSTVIGQWSTGDDQAMGSDVKTEHKKGRQDAAPP